MGRYSGTAAPPGGQRIDLSGATVIPGLVGMHEHLSYPSAAGIRKVKLVFKGGVGYDPAKLLESVRGAVPLH